MRLLKRFLSRESVFLEIGCGDCAVSLEASKQVKQVFAVDVSKEIVSGIVKPRNFEFVLSDGRSVPITHNSAHVAYSNQLMEHLHPDDALVQLSDIYNALLPGGVYICLTPNRLTGPHDISKYFDTVATGFHLKEYTVSELSKMFRAVGFSRVKILVGGMGRFMRLSPFWMYPLEKVLETLPYSLRMHVVSNVFGNALLGIRLVGTK
jgi:SAM-dependent methyltransferase